MTIYLGKIIKEYRDDNKLSMEKATETKKSSTIASSETQEMVEIANKLLEISSQLITISNKLTNQSNQ